MNSNLQNYLDKKRGEVEGARGRIKLDVTGLELASICDAIEQVELIDALRAEEGHEVTIIHDNPDFGAGPDCAVSTSDTFGENHRTFYGDTVLDALRAAHRAMKEKETNNEPA